MQLTSTPTLSSRAKPRDLVSRAAGKQRRWTKLRRHWRRLTRWEFWPPYLFYPPVVAYIFYLGAKHRSMTLFTAANPAIPAGGFVGESKHEILQNLKQAAEWLPASILI